jgi:Tfp pilus assembly protein PilX
MKRFRQQQGIALITALMLTVISMTIVLVMYYLITLAVQVSGTQKRYKTALEASYGGAEITLKEVLPAVLRGLSDTEINNKFSGLHDLNLQVASTACTKRKLIFATKDWGNTCSDAEVMNPTVKPDVTFSLQSASPGAAPYTVSAKIIDTILGNTDMSGLQLEGGGTAEQATTIATKHFPYVYRLEVIAERSQTASERGKVSVLYAY